MTNKINKALSATFTSAAMVLAVPTSANPINDVNDDLLKAIRLAATSPTSSGRNIAIVQLAMYDSANAASGTKFKPYAYAGPKVAGVSADAAALQAGYSAIKQLYPTQYVSLGLEARLQSKLTGLNLSPAKLAASTAFGTAIATNQFTARLTDGVSTANSPPHVYKTGIGDFRSTTANPAAQPAAPGYGNVTTFVVANSSQFGAGPAPEVGSAQWVTDFNEVRTLGQLGGTTIYNQDSALFWADGAGTFTASGHWLTIAGSVSQSQSLGTLGSARLGAMMATAMADASITAWQTKYEDPLWRPVTAIRACDDANCATVGNGEIGWTPFLKATPNHPSYVSAHSAVSAAAASALAGYFGNDSIGFCSTPDNAPATFTTPAARCYGGFWEAAAEAGQSRIYGGIHYQFDNVAGLQMGRGIGEFVASEAFGAVPEPASWAMLIAGFGLTGTAMRRRRVRAVAA